MSTQTLAVVDGIRYETRTLVYAIETDGAAALYCTLDEWPTTTPAQLAQRDAEIARLSTQVADLQRLVEELAQQPKQPAVKATKAPTAKHCRICDRGEAEGVTFYPSEKRLCRECHTKRTNARKQAKKQAEQPAAPVVAPIRLVLPDDPTWRCPDCDPVNTGAFARSLSDPVHCVKHAKTNGHKVAA